MLRFCVLKSDFHQLEHAMTRSIIVFRDADGNIVMILYIGHDGYESGWHQLRITSGWLPRIGRSMFIYWYITPAFIVLS